MATDITTDVDTPRQSFNSGEAVHLPEIMSSTGIHYFAEHDTIKLSEQNFLLWKHQLLLILEGYGLEGFVLGTTPPPTTFILGTDGQLVANPVFLVHNKQDKFLALWLLSTVSDAILVHLTAAKTSHDIWTTINRRFGAKSNIKLSSMRHELYSIKKGSLTIKDYISKVKGLSDNLTATGCLVTEQEQVSVILAGLPIEFESIRILASVTFLSLELVTEMLLDCEARQLALLTDLPLQANMVTQSQQGDFDNMKSSSNSARSFHQNQRGQARGWSRGRSRGSSRGWSGFKPQCQLCGCSTFVSGSRLLHLKNILHVPADIRTGKILLEGHMHNGLYHFDFSWPPLQRLSSPRSVGSPLMCNTQIPSSVELWHDRLGHPYHTTLARILKSCKISFRHRNLQFMCTPCKVPFELVASDVWGPSHMSSNDFSYYLSFVDMYSRFTWLYFLKSKSEIF
ncbi:retrovirus-related Pol polyprotein from transposon TNT 1-94 [Gossypium australe]|uniref:Retrovirus-related Pol polyprotein from transposon TNT 1-94 n=1 Tax=Gossypium australe TaxID=47621 RepID=A0A5B6V7J9_9ROSI|nr:retrovirus-related Pol polyprotein from transposon TNT 1-94 [Gossypium australe]